MDSLALRSLFAVCAFVVLGALFTPPVAHASGSVSVGAGRSVLCTSDGADTSECFATLQGVCDFLTAAAVAGGNGQIRNRISGSACVIENYYDGSWRTFEVLTPVPRQLPGSCPANSAPNAGSCTCADGYSPDATGTSCVAPTCPPFNTPSGSSATVVQQDGNSTMVCISGCKWIPSVSAKNGSDPTDTHTYGWGPFYSMASACSGSGGGAPITSPAASAPVQLPPGKCPGTVNGTAVVVPCSSTTETSTASGSTSSTSASGVQADGPVTSTSTSTTCAGGACTTATTSTVTNPDGSKSTTTTADTKPQDQDSFCKANPSLSICKDSSISGSCAAVACTGDAIQCAIAKEQATRACQLLGDGGPAAQAAVAKGNEYSNGEALPNGHPGKNPTAVSLNLPGAIDSSPMFGTPGSCPTDVPVAITSLQTVFWIRFSMICAHLALIGAAMKTMAYFVAGRIIFKGGI